MKLLLVNSAVPELWGGGEKWFVEAAKWFATRGHDVILCARTDSKLYDAAFDAKLSVIATPFGGDFDPFAIARAHKILKTHKPEAILTNFNKEAWHFGLARDKMDTRLIARHGFPLWDNKLHHRLLFNLLDQVVVNADSIRERYLKLGIAEKKLTVIANGVKRVEQQSGELRAKLNLDSSTFLAVAAGRLDQQKRFDILLRAWKAASSATPDAHLVIFGSGPQEENLKALAHELGIQESVTIAGFDSEFAQFVVDADLFLLTSENEGTPNAVLEAMSAGVPVLGFDVGAMDKILDGELQEFLIPSGHTKLLAERLHYWLARQEELQTRREQFAKRAAQEFSFDASMQSYANLIYSMVTK